METEIIKDFSQRLKALAKGLSFLGNPRYDLSQLKTMFPDQVSFINELEDYTTPFIVNIKEKNEEIEKIKIDLDHSSLPNHIKEIFLSRIEDYSTLILMMENFGKEAFYTNSVKLYGTSKNLKNQASFHRFVNEIPSFCSTDCSEIYLSINESIEYLKNKLIETFPEEDIAVKPSTSLLSDSSAGRRVLKLNPQKNYTIQQLNIFLVHEGWAHLGTSLNGADQKEHLWLGTWAPRTTYLQEGLAILTEIITGSLNTERWQKIIQRHLATMMAERGSNVKEVYEFLQHEGMEKLDAFKLALRIFRGVPLEGGMAFTKELLYLHGLPAILSHINGLNENLKKLWVGKVSFQEHATLLANWNEFNPQIRYYPSALSDPLAIQRLEKLKELTKKTFSSDF